MEKDKWGNFDERKLIETGIDILDLWFEKKLWEPKGGDGDGESDDDDEGDGKGGDDDGGAKKSNSECVKTHKYICRCNQTQRNDLSFCTLHVQFENFLYFQKNDFH